MKKSTDDIQLHTEKRELVRYCFSAFHLYYVIMKHQENQDGFKFNGTHQLPVNADGVNLLNIKYHKNENRSFIRH
jgi:hypothetical protein